MYDSISGTWRSRTMAGSCSLFLLILLVKSIDFFGEGCKFRGAAENPTSIVGFMDPMLVNQKKIQYQPKSTLGAIYRFLEQQNYKQQYYCLTTLSKCGCHLFSFFFSYLINVS
uniref:Uncharacterized protein n=1 Tax=Setaria viridis TaxID=4556 RepID=A0A4U6TEX5_SETVI|nr:hypothetical protein SEVIR_8G085733v2 [Setaria viridis]